MEIFDVYNRQGEIIRTEYNRRDLKDGEYCLGINAYIYNSEKQFLIQQRAFTKSFLAGAWDIHMGHAVTGESSEQAVIREVHEEIGILCKPEDLFFLFRNIRDDIHYLTDIYFIKTDAGIEECMIQESEVEAVKYISKDEMIALVNGMTHRPDEYRGCVLQQIERI